MKRHGDDKEDKQVDKRPRLHLVTSHTTHMQAFTITDKNTDTYIHACTQKIVRPIMAASCGNCTATTRADPTGVTLLICARCRRQHYCSKACQRVHWRVHRVSCSALEVGGVIVLQSCVCSLCACRVSVFVCVFLHVCVCCCWSSRLGVCVRMCVCGVCVSTKNLSGLTVLPSDLARLLLSFLPGRAIPSLLRVSHTVRRLCACLHELDLSSVESWTM